MNIHSLNHNSEVHHCLYISTATKTQCRFYFYIQGSGGGYVQYYTIYIKLADCIGNIVLINIYHTYCFMYSMNGYSPGEAVVVIVGGPGIKKRHIYSCHINTTGTHLAHHVMFYTILSTSCNVLQHT